jgi:ketosteroid isomerase-like protein
MFAAGSCYDDPNTDYQATLSSLVDSERAFSRAAAEMGIHESFLAFLSADAVIFRPRAINAHEFLRAQPEQPGILAWEPVFAGVSQAGDLGFTTGPWYFRPDSSSEPAAHGEYFSFWKRQEDGSWRVVIDHGVTHPAPTAKPEALHAVARGWNGAAADPKAERDILLRLDGSYTGAAEQHAIAGLRVLRDGAQPLIGSEAVEALRHEHEPGTIAWKSLGGEVSSSGDIGYTYGEYVVRSDSDEPEAGVYMRAWHRQNDGSWRVVVDLMTRT